MPVRLPATLRSPRAEWQSANPRVRLLVATRTLTQRAKKKKKRRWQGPAVSRSSACYLMSPIERILMASLRVLVGWEPHGRTSAIAVWRAARRGGKGGRGGGGGGARGATRRARGTRGPSRADLAAGFAHERTPRSGRGVGGPAGAHRAAPAIARARERGGEKPIGAPRAAGAEPAYLSPAARHRTCSLRAGRVRKAAVDRPARPKADDP